MRRKARIFECANCFETVGVDNLKRLVIPVISEGPKGMDVHFEGRWLCGECYEDFFYFLHEEWDAQNLTKTPPKSPPGGDKDRSGPSKPVSSESIEVTPSDSSERGQPGTGPSKPAAAMGEPLEPTPGLGASVSGSERGQSGPLKPAAERPMQSSAQPAPEVNGSERGQPGAGGAPEPVAQEPALRNHPERFTAGYQRAVQQQDTPPPAEPPEGEE